MQSAANIAPYNVAKFGVVALTETLRMELDEGELITMAPAAGMHGRIESRITRVLDRFLEEHPVGELLTSDTGFILSRDPDVVRCPDLAFLRADKATAVRDQGFVETAPDLALEIVSPSDRATALSRKVRQYLEAGTHTVWVVHRDTREVHVHEASGTSRFLTADQILEAPDLLPGFSVKVADLFPGHAGGSAEAG